MHAFDLIAALLTSWQFWLNVVLVLTVVWYIKARRDYEERCDAIFARRADSEEDRIITGQNRLLDRIITEIDTAPHALSRNDIIRIIRGYKIDGVASFTVMPTGVVRKASPGMMHIMCGGCQRKLVECTCRKAA